VAVSVSVAVAVSVLGGGVGGGAGVRGGVCGGGRHSILCFTFFRNTRPNTEERKYASNNNSDDLHNVHLLKIEMGFQIISNSIVKLYNIIREQNV
jgi:hypothetical protein